MSVNPASRAYPRNVSGRITVPVPTDPGGGHPVG